MLNVLASLGGLLPDDGERLYDVAWDARPKQMVVARSMPETAAQATPSWDVIHSKDMAPTALHLMQQSIATNADAVHNLDSLPKQKPAGEVPCDIGCPNDSVRMIERRGPHAPHRPEDMNHERGGPHALRRPVAMVATAGQAMPEHQGEEQPTERPRLAMPEAVAGDADDPDDADDSVGRPRHAMLRRLASRLEEEAAQEGTRRTPEMQAVVRAAVANAAASKDGKPLLAEARRIAQPQLRRIRRAPDKIDGAPSSCRPHKRPCPPAYPHTDAHAHTHTHTHAHALAHTVPVPPNTRANTCNHFELRLSGDALHHVAQLNCPRLPCQMRASDLSPAGTRKRYSPACPTWTANGT